MRVSAIGSAGSGLKSMFKDAGKVLDEFWGQIAISSHLKGITCLETLPAGYMNERAYIIKETVLWKSIKY